MITKRPRSPSKSIRKHHKVALLNRRDQRIFEWCGPAQDADDAVRSARDAYALSIAAIYKTRGLSHADIDADTKAAYARASQLSAPNAWRVTWLAAHEASEHPRASRNGLRKSMLVRLLHDAVHADEKCLRAMASGANLEIAIWMQRVGQFGLVAIDSCVFAATGETTTTIKLADSRLRDAVRILVLRCVSLYHSSQGPRPGQTYQGLKFPIAPRPASVRQASVANGVFPPASLIDWLEQDGLDAVGNWLRVPGLTQ